MLKSLPKYLRRDGARIYYGHMLVATLHEDFDLIKAIQNQKYLLRFGERNRAAVCGPPLKRNPEKLKQPRTTTMQSRI